METNFFGVLALTRALLPTLRAQRRGKILIVFSEAAFFGLPANSIYFASKWAIEGWAESIAYDVSPFGISTFDARGFPSRCLKMPALSLFISGTLRRLCRLAMRSPHELP